MLSTPGLITVVLVSIFVGTVFCYLEMLNIPPRPIAMLLAHMDEFEPALEHLADGDHSLFIRMRNKLIKQTLEWEELCAQVRLISCSLQYYQNPAC